MPGPSVKVLGDLLQGTSSACSCGRTHDIRTGKVVVEPDVIGRIPELVPALVDAERILLVADQRTWEVAGARLAAALRPAYEVTTCRLRDPARGHITAAVRLIDELATEFPDRHDLLVAVGSGTVNDITKELAHRRQRPYLVLATAASMNGYTSAIVALLAAGLKITRPATPPLAVFADPAMLAAAPRELTLAGLGDLVSRPYCGCDWKLAALLRDEYHCPLPERLLAEPFARLLESLPQRGCGDPKAVTELFELLLISGLAMAITGTSSPASGGEHLLSHYWDMTRIRDSLPINLHGAQVGVAALLVDTLYKEILEHDFARARFRPGPDDRQSEQEIREVFGPLAAAVWPQWQAKLAARSQRDLRRLREHEPAIKAEIARTLAIGTRVRHALTACQAPTSGSQLGLSAAELRAAIRHARKIRTRYTVLDLAAELALLEPFAASFAGS